MIRRLTAAAAATVAAASLVLGCASDPAPNPVRDRMGAVTYDACYTFASGVPYLENTPASRIAYAGEVNSYAKDSPIPNIRAAGDWLRRAAPDGGYTWLRALNQFAKLCQENGWPAENRSI